MHGHCDEDSVMEMLVGVGCRLEETGFHKCLENQGRMGKGHLREATVAQGQGLQGRWGKMR